MSAAKKLVAKHGVPMPSLDLVTKKDLDGIKKALLFFVERERDKEMSEEMHRSFSGRWKDDKCREDFQKKTKREINKKYDDITKGLK